MVRSTLCVALATMLMAFQARPVEWTFDGQLRVGMTRQDLKRLAETLQVSFQCSAPPPLELPVGNVEICRLNAQSLAVSAVVVQGNDGEAQVAAFAVKGAASGFQALSDGLREQLGAPARASNGRWGQNLVWQMGARWTTLHSTCALHLSCLEVSQDMTARRLARSAGVFMPTYQPV